MLHLTQTLEFVITKITTHARKHPDEDKICQMRKVKVTQVRTPISTTGNYKSKSVFTLCTDVRDDYQILPGVRSVASFIVSQSLVDHLQQFSV